MQCFSKSTINGRMRSTALFVSTSPRSVDHILRRRRTAFSPIRMAATDAPYGSWPSPISSKAITASSISISSLKLTSQDLLWVEGRPQEGGRYVLVKHDPANPAASDRGAVDLTPAGTNVRTRVHEYGGGAVVVSPSTIYYSEFSTQDLMALDAGSQPRILVKSEGKYRFADGVFDPNGNQLFMIREDHTHPNPSDVRNELVSVSCETGAVEVVATGRDFYMAPRLSPDGKTLAYITWDHPSMPWDYTELRSTDMSSPQTSEHKLLAGSDGDTSVLQPAWSPDGVLHYISDASGFYNIYRMEDDTAVSVAPMSYDFGGRAPGWTLGQQGYLFSGDGQLGATYIKDGETRLLIGDVGRFDEYGTEHGLPPQIGSVVSNGAGCFYLLGGSAAKPGGVWKWEMQSKSCEMLACSSTLSIPEDMVSVPKAITFPTTLGDAYGYYYPPTNGQYKCTTEKPPLLVKAHGGPTACTSPTFKPGIQYFTSRGFALLDVDYGGSTGYGREYRRRLRGQWGIVDIDDVCAGAQYLVREGLADEKRLAIDGGSAGGYTTLGALAFRDVFTAGCSLFGVADLSALAADTHKFESRYLDGLIGKWPEEEEIYTQRAPIHSVETLSCPILLLQGDEDKIVPPAQAETMHAALLSRGIPCALKIYKGEQHGFRQAKNIEDALDSELYFYSRVFGFVAPGVAAFPIDNLK